MMASTPARSEPSWRNTKPLAQSQGLLSFKGKSSLGFCLLRTLPPTMQTATSDQALAELRRELSFSKQTISRLQKASACVMTTDNKAKTVRVVGATPEITKKGEEMIRAAIQKVQEVAATRGSGPGRGRGRGAEGRGGRGRGRGRG